MPCLTPLRCRTVIFIIVGPLFVSFRRDASVDSSKKGAELFLSGNEMFPACPSDPETVTHVQVQLDVTQLLAAQASMRVVADFDAFGDLLASREASTIDLRDNETLAIAVAVVVRASMVTSRVPLSRS